MLIISHSRTMRHENAFSSKSLEMVKKVGKARKIAPISQNTSKRAEIKRYCVNFDIKKDWFQLFSWKLLCGMLERIHGHDKEGIRGHFQVVFQWPAVKK